MSSESEAEITVTEAAILLGVKKEKIAKWQELGEFSEALSSESDNRIRVQGLISFLEQKKIPVPRSLRDFGKRKILVVEDDLVVLQAVRRSLELTGKYDVIFCTNGMEASAAIRDEEPDMVISDLYMPSMDGFKLCRMIRDTKPEIKIIAISGGIEGDKAEKFLREVPDIFLKKPFEQGTLLSAVEDLLPDS